MGSLIELGVMIILWIQSLGAWLETPMQLFTFLGNEEFYLFIAPAIYWCLDASLGLRLGLGLMLSGIINSGFKLIFQGPRPYWVDANVKAFSTETSFGVPSGHAQNATVVWGLMAKRINRGWAWAVVLVLIALISFSRMYLGIHFPHDILMGWLIGAFVLWAIIVWERKFLNWFKQFSIAYQVALAFCASIILILIASLVRTGIGDFQIPQSWITTAANAYPGASPITPLALSGVVSNAGVLFGLSVGAIWLYQTGWLDASGDLWKRLLRFLIGVIGVFILWFGLGEVFPRGETFFPYTLRYLRYALVGFWISGLAPWAFIRLKIAKSSESR